jgi:mycothiol S-conjugate amidase
MVIIDEGQLPGRPDAEISATIDIRSTLRTKIEALRCYKTQIMSNFFFFTAPEDVATDVLGHEDFVLSASRVKTTLPETDLFAGVDL